MLRVRVVPCLDVADGRVVKGTRFVDLVDEGDPAELAERYAREGADELVFLDISAAPEGSGSGSRAIRNEFRKPSSAARIGTSSAIWRATWRASVSHKSPQR